jgi:tetratricopeptide (TPR) repeat protein
MSNPISAWLNKFLSRQQRSKRSTPEKIINTFKNGVREVDEGRPKKAIKYFTEAISESRNSSKLHHYRADAYALDGEHEQAIVDYDNSVRLNPSYPDTYLDRGNSHYQLGHLKTALKDFSEAIRLKPDWGEAFANRAVIHAELGNTEEANFDAKVAISMEVDALNLTEMLEIARNNAENL